MYSAVRTKLRAATGARVGGRLDYLEGRKFCVVFVKVIDAEQERVRLQCLRGRASVDRGRLKVVDRHGAVFEVPSSSLPMVMPSDGTVVLKDAEYFVMVRLDENIQLFNDSDVES